MMAECFEPAIFIGGFPMGKVFSWKEISKNEVPRLADFDRVGNRVLRVLGSCKNVLGGAFFGSYAHGAHNIRSDMDCVLVYKEGARETVNRTLEALVLFAHKRYVPLSFTKQGDGMAQTSFRHVGELFLFHLRQDIVKGRVIKRDPTDFFRDPLYTPREELWSYLRSKIMMFENTFPKVGVLDSSRFHHLLGDILDTPVHVARKVLYFLGVIPASDAKEEIVRAYGKCAISPFAHDLFSELVSLDREYNDHIRRQFISPDEKMYRKMLKSIKNAGWKTTAFVQENALFLEKLP